MRYCRICELLGFDVSQYLEQALERLEQTDPSRLASEEEYGRRLSICAQCKEKLEDGTCKMCGCYVVLRARMAEGKCPYRNQWR